MVAGVIFWRFREFDSAEIQEIGTDRPIEDASAAGGGEKSKV